MEMYYYIDETMKGYILQLFQGPFFEVSYEGLTKAQVIAILKDCGITNVRFPKIKERITPGLTYKPFSNIQASGAGSKNAIPLQ